MVTSSRLRPQRLLRNTALCGLAAAGLFAATPAQAQSDSSATVKLIQLLIQKGILSQSQAADLLSQAQAESGTAPARRTRKGAHAAAQQAAAQDYAPPPEPGAPKGQVRVTYVPQFVRDQIAGEVRTQVMQQARDEGWAKPNALPDWVSHIQLYGDLRLRYQGDYEDHGNGDLSLFPDFNTINAGGGFDTSGAAGVPTVNINQNRDRFRIRARVGVRAQIASWIGADVRIATGNDNSPVSENQTLGTPGDFSKYAIYIDRAYLTLTPLANTVITAGREPNPFFVSDLMFAPDLNFDGVSMQVTQPLSEQASVFFAGGAYPVFDTSLNFSSVNQNKGSSHDAYLFAAQAGGEYKFTQNYVAKLGAGYFAYSNVSGKESAPCLLLTTSDSCSTDNTRPGFVQSGNTMFGLRDIVTNASSIAQTPQYYGLASHFGVLDVHGRFEVRNYDPIRIALEGEFVKNLAFNRAYILARTPVNNLGNAGAYVGGDTGYMGKITFGYSDIVNLWDWNASFAYKYLQSDAVLDAFTDPDFHLGGTNARGYVIGGNLGIAHNTSLAVRWLSANEVSGPKNGNDVLQLDLNAKF